MHGVVWTCVVLVERHWVNRRPVFRTVPGLRSRGPNGAGRDCRTRRCSGRWPGWLPGLSTGVKHGARLSARAISMVLWAANIAPLSDNHCTGYGAGSVPKRCSTQRTIMSRIISPEMPAVVATQEIASRSWQSRANRHAQPLRSSRRTPAYRSTSGNSTGSSPPGRRARVLAGIRYGVRATGHAFSSAGRRAWH